MKARTMTPYNEIRNRALPVFKRVSWPESLLDLELSLRGILDFGRDKME